MQRAGGYGLVIWLIMRFSNAVGMRYACYGQFVCLIAVGICGLTGSIYIAI